ncbi:MAG: hypothetical protein M1819_005868 [Sarea resinae]|nr:MAG: hypothetical protein M1819_005868 [Sarea resinae]
MTGRHVDLLCSYLLSPSSPHWSVASLANKAPGLPSPSSSLHDHPSQTSSFHFSPKKSTSSATIPPIREASISFPPLERPFHTIGPSGVSPPAYGRVGPSNTNATSFHTPSRSDPSAGYIPYSSHPRPADQPPQPDGSRLQRQAPDSQSSTNSTPSRGIWTGAQFLPRFIGEQNIPGEGPCFFYDDGTHCKTLIDGEPVNAHWGVTKAGKPRKRLAVACLTCREKKIKCEPDLPKCVQCEKFGRNCRFQNAPRGHRMSPEPRSGEASETKSATASPSQSSEAKPVQSPSFERKDMSSPKAQKRLHCDDRAPKTVDPITLSQRDPNSPAAKKRRLSSPDVSWGMISGLGRRRRDHREPVSPEFACEPKCQPPRLLDPTAFNWQTDPYELDPDLTVHTIDLYFDHINSATYHIFSRRPFMRWLENCSKKNREDLMLLYTMMAMGSLFSPFPKRRSYGKHWFSIARYAVDKSQGEFSLQLCQSRLLISLYQFATGNSTGAWDYCGAGLRLASGLRLNLEEGVMTFREDEPLEYGLKRATLIECRRRTFWSGFLMDSFTGFCMGRFNILRTDDIFTRLPCKEEAYEHQIKTSAPYFDNGIIDPELTRADSDLPGLMGHLVIVSSIWDDVLANIYRSLHRSKNSYEEEYEKFYAHAQRRINDWHDQLPSHFRWSAQNLDQSIAQGSVANFLTIHAFHHITLMRLHRHVRPALLSHDHILRNLRASISHARNFLNMMALLSEESRASRLPEEHNKSLSLSSTPFVGFAILAAADILTARGPMARCTETLQLVNGGLTVVHELASVWASAKGQTKALVSRIAELGTCLLSGDEQNKRNPGREREGESQLTSKEGGMFKCKAPLETTYPLDSDLVYSAPVGLVLEVFA